MGSSGPRLHRPRRSLRAIYSPRRTLQWVYILLPALPLAVSLGTLSLADRSRSLLIEADTEIFQVTVGPGRPLVWDIEDFELLECDSLKGGASGRQTAPVKVQPADRRLVLEEGARVEVTRSGERGTLSVEVSGGPQQAGKDPCQAPAVAFLSSGGFQMEPLRGDLRLALSHVKMPEPRAVVLPLRGHITVGDDVAEGVRFLLLQGSLAVIEVIEPPRFACWYCPPLRYISERRELIRGDRILLHRNSERRPAAALAGEFAVGFARIALGSVMTVSLVTAAEQLYIVSLSGPARAFGPSLWTRVLNEPCISYALALSGLLTGGVAWILAAPWIWRESSRPGGASDASK